MQENQLLPEQDLIALSDMFARLLAEQFDHTRLRTVLESDDGFDMSLWQKMAELGLLGLLVNTEQGGLGLSIVEVQAILEQTGKALFTSPFIASCVVAPTLMQQADQVPAETLSAICAGDLIVAEAGFDEFNFNQAAEFAVTAQLVDDRWLLSGSIEIVQHLCVAKKCLILASADSDPAVFLIDMASAGVVCEPLQANDPSLNLSSLKLDQVLAQCLSGIGVKQIQTALDLATVALAGEQAGASREVFDRTVDYLKTRFQFGRPIGSFQALKHMAADLLVEVESMTSAARFAARALQSGAPDSGSLVGLAGFTCSEGFRHVAAEAIQLHGGIAYTTEHFAHLYWRRAQSCQWLYGSPDQHRERYLAELETTE